MASPNSNSNAASNPAVQSIQQSKTSHNEKVLLLDLKYAVGQYIEYRDIHGNTKYAFKNGPHEYMNLSDMTPINLGSSIGDLLKGNIASDAQVKNAINNNPNILLKEFGRRKLMIDFESSFIQNTNNVEGSNIYSVSMGGPHATDKGRWLGADYHVTDVFNDLFSNSEDKRYIAENRINKEMSHNVQQGFFKRLREVGKRALGADEYDNAFTKKGGATNLAELVSNKGTLSKILDFTNNSQSPIELDPASVGLVGQAGTEFKVGVGPSNFAHQFINGSLGITEKTTLGSINPKGGIDYPLYNHIAKLDKSPIMHDMIDLRGYDLFRNAHLFPSLTDNMSHTLGPAMNEIADKLRLSDKQTKRFLEMGEKGIASFYKKGSSAEAMFETLRYAAGKTKDQSYTAQTHESMWDVKQTSDWHNEMDSMHRAAVQERMNPGLQNKSVRASLQVGMLRTMAVEAAAQESTLRDSVGSAELKKQYYDRFDGNVNFSKIEKQITANMESVFAQRLEKNMVSGATKQFGGGTVAQLLAGSFLVAGVHSGIRKINEQFRDNRSNNMEGLNHNSIMTNMRRLVHTDFGSGWYGQVTASARILSKMFVNKMASPDSMFNTIKKGISKINAEVNAVKGKDRYRDLFRNEDKLNELSKKLFDPDNGHLSRLIDSATTEGEWGSKINAGLKKGVTKLGEVAVDYASAIGKFGADKQLKQSISEAMSTLLITKNSKGKKTLTASGFALGIGAFGALGMMAMRGKFDPNLSAADTKSPYTQDKLNYAERSRPKTRQLVQDIKTANYNAYGIKPPETQKGIYARTDFGSPIRMGLKTSWRYSKRMMSKVINSTGKWISKRVSNNTDEINIMRKAVDPKYDSITRNPELAFTDKPRVTNYKEIITGPEESAKNVRKEVQKKKIEIQAKQGALADESSKYKNIRQPGKLHNIQADMSRNIDLKSGLIPINKKMNSNTSVKISAAIRKIFGKSNPTIKEHISPPINKTAKRVSKQVLNKKGSSSPLVELDQKQRPRISSRAADSVRNNIKDDLLDVQKGTRNAETSIRIDREVEKGYKESGRINPINKKVKTTVQSPQRQSVSHMERYMPSDAKMIQLQNERPSDVSFSRANKYSSSKGISSSYLDMNPTSINTSGVHSVPNPTAIVNSAVEPKYFALDSVNPGIKSSINSLKIMNDNLSTSMVRPPKYSGLGKEIKHGSSHVPYIPVLK
jgi:hypothetical protein